MLDDAVSPVRSDYLLLCFRKVILLFGVITSSFIHVLLLTPVFLCRTNWIEPDLQITLVEQELLITIMQPRQDKRNERCFTVYQNLC